MNSDAFLSLLSRLFFLALVFPLLLPLPSAAQPYITLTANGGMTDDCAYGGDGDGDGSVDPGEVIEIWSEVWNFSSTDATNVSCLLECDPADSDCVHVNVSKASAAFGDIPAAQLADNSADRWTIEFFDTIACDRQVDFLFHFTYDQGSNGDSGSLTTAAPADCIPCLDTGGPNPDIAALTVELDACSLGLGDQDGEIEPGETITLRITLTNSGTSTATNIDATLASSDVAITQPSSSLASLALSCNLPTMKEATSKTSTFPWHRHPPATSAPSRRSPSTP